MSYRLNFAQKSCLPLLFLPFVSLVWAQGAAQTMQSDLNAALEVDRKTAAEIARVQNEIRQFEEQNRTLNLQIPVMELEVKKLERYLESTREKIERLQESHRRYGEMALYLEEKLVEIVQKLKTDIASGLPFLSAERSRRVAFLEESLSDPALSLGEKYRRVAEALTVEADYGLTSETTTEEIVLDGKTVSASVIRLGRLAMFALTPDQTKAGVYDRTKGEFVDSAVHLSDIQMLFEAVNSRIRQGLVTVPLALRTIKENDK